MLPGRDDVPGEVTRLVDDYRALDPELRGRLLAVALQGDVARSAMEQASAVATGFVDATQRGRIDWKTDEHRLAVLAGAEPDDHRTAAGVRPSDRSHPHGAALHLLLADEPFDVDDLVDAAQFFAFADRPSWAVHCLVNAADAAQDPGVVAALAAKAANIAAFDGDFWLAQRVLECFTSADTKVLIRTSAPTRALRQVLVENDLNAARATVLARLDEPDLDSTAVGEALTVYALANIIDSEVSAWSDFVRACFEAEVPLHPEIVTIATTYGAPNSALETHLTFPVAADGRGWSQLAGCMASVLHLYRDMRLGSLAPPVELGLSARNRLVRTVAATWDSVRLAHNQHWDELQLALRIAMETTAVVPVPLMRVNAETLLAMLEAFRGERDAARSRVDRVRGDASVRRAYRLRLVLDSVEALIEGSQGNYERALALLTTREPDIFDLTVGPYGPVELFDFVDYSILLNHHEEARERVQRTRELLSHHRSERADFVLAACDAALGAGTNVQPAAELLARAQSSPFVYESARLRLVYAEQLRRMGRSAEAKRQLLRAEIDLRIVKSGAWMDRVQRELRAGQRETPTATSDLTEQEVRIAELAAAGLSNKEIGAQLYVSPRTVGGHLYKIYPKLGVTSRAQLRDALSRNAKVGAGGPPDGRESSA